MASISWPLIIQKTHEYVRDYDYTIPNEYEFDQLCYTLEAVEEWKLKAAEATEQNFKALLEEGERLTEEAWSEAHAHGWYIAVAVELSDLMDEFKERKTIEL